MLTFSDYGSAQYNNIAINLQVAISGCMVTPSYQTFSGQISGQAKFDLTSLPFIVNDLTSLPFIINDLTSLPFIINENVIEIVEDNECMDNFQSL